MTLSKASSQGEAGDARSPRRAVQVIHRRPLSGSALQKGVGTPQKPQLNMMSHAGLHCPYKTAASQRWQIVPGTMLL